MLSPSLEDYLEEIYRFSQNKVEVRVTDIANKLSVSLPSVSKAIKTLSAKGYLHYEPYQSLHLSKKGEKLGEFLVERNKTLQEFLTTIGSECNKEKEAEAMEHYLSQPTLEAITSLVNFFRENSKYQDQFIQFKEDDK
ncbi:iron dependent repressor, metal binding and dimerization domain protein [Halonatronum saccharophilum]|uniref:iron dependent repressor, metal binding and dimerization domain protein n=1 Tax=Halonatronum saccharophilum TaxID=150060 RepID=UPI0004823374